MTHVLDTVRTGVALAVRRPPANDTAAAHPLTETSLVLAGAVEASVHGRVPLASAPAPALAAPATSRTSVTSRFAARVRPRSTALTSTPTYGPANGRGRLEQPVAVSPVRRLAQDRYTASSISSRLPAVPMKVNRVPNSKQCSCLQGSGIRLRKTCRKR